MKAFYFVCAVFLFSVTSRAATFTVNSTGDGADAVPGNGICADGSGNCTLRAAITETNATVATDTINFGIGSGAKTINVLTQLDTISETVTINGTTQPGFSGKPLIQVTGPGAGNADGLVINADNCVVRGLVINGFGRAVFITGMANNPIAEGNVVAGCYIGTDATGSAIAAVPNGYGIFMDDNGVASGAQGNTIGGLAASDRNVISGNSNHTGIIIGGSVTSGNVIKGNYIGTNASGTGAVPNGYVGGIWILSPNNVIGGLTPSARNVISGNSNGIFFGGANAHGNVVQGNYIGTNASGTAALGNGGGIIIGDDTQNANSGAHDNIIGGPSAGAGNLISGNTTGVSIGNRFTAANTTGNVVQGNRIGTNAAGTSAIANTTGVFISGGAKSNIIGGTAVGEGNTIAFNTSDGVGLSPDTSLLPVGNSIRGNAVFSNGGLGINLQPSGEANNTITPNDALDSDSGPNALQNFPLITSVVPGTSTTVVAGTFNSTANQTFNLDFYSSPSPNSSGNGEGQAYLGSPASGNAIITTDGNGDATFNVTFNSNMAGQFLTATATSSMGDTSEFSPAVKVVVSLSINSLSILEGNLGDANKFLNFTVTLSNQVTQAVTVKYNTADTNSATGKAKAGQDYVATSGTLTIPAGQIKGIITVPVIGDNLNEDNEIFFLNLSAPTVANIDTGQGVGTIIDNDAIPILSSSDIVVTEGTGGTKNANFTITLNAVSGRAVQFTCNTADGTARTPSDYTATRVNLTIPAGATSAKFSVPIITDSTDEYDETFYAFLTLPVNAKISTARVQCTITDDDAPPTVSIDSITSKEYNGGKSSATFHLKLSAISGKVVTVNFATAAGTTFSATAGVDYEAVPSATVSISAGSLIGIARVVILGDTLDEENETYKVNLSSPVNATLAAAPDNQGIGTILDDDTAPALSIDDVSITESNSGSKNLNFTVSLSAASAKTISVNYATADGTARSTSDYGATTGQLVFAPGITTRIVTVVINGDTVVEPNETLYMFLSTAVNASIGKARSVGTIINDDGSG